MRIESSKRCYSCDCLREWLEKKYLSLLWTAFHFWRKKKQMSNYIWYSTNRRALGSLIRENVELWLFANNFYIRTEPAKHPFLLLSSLLPPWLSKTSINVYIHSFSEWKCFLLKKLGSGSTESDWKSWTNWLKWEEHLYNLLCKCGWSRNDETIVIRAPNTFSTFMFHYSHQDSALRHSSVFQAAGDRKQEAEQGYSLAFVWHFLDIHTTIYSPWFFPWGWWGKWILEGRKTIFLSRWSRGCQHSEVLWWREKRNINFPQDMISRSMYILKWV